jgi:glucans biosynthesis protein
VSAEPSSARQDGLRDGGRCGAQVCGARTRAGGRCRKPAAKGKRRCRLHGGAPGSGGQPGNRNAHKHGFYGKEAIAERRRLRVLIRALEAGLEGVG